MTTLREQLKLLQDIISLTVTNKITTVEERVNKQIATI